MRQFLNPKTLRTFQPAQCLVLASTAAKRLRRFEAVVRTASKARARILIVHYDNSDLTIFLVLQHQFWKISIIDDLNCIFELVASFHRNSFQGARTHGAKGAQRERQPMRQPGNLRVRQVSCTHAGDWQARPLVWQLGGWCRPPGLWCLPDLASGASKIFESMRAFLRALVYVVQKN